ncbi:MAG: hypothetical protein ABIP56_02365 [Dokdonella sp.]
MKKLLLVLSLAVSLGGLAACSGGSNSNGGNNGAPPPVVTPPPGPAIDTRFETFVKAILATTSETGSPVSVNQNDFTYTENFSAYANLFGG